MARPEWHQEAKDLHAGGLTIKDVAAHLGRHYSTVYAAIRDDALKPERIEAKRRQNRLVTTRKQMARRALEDVVPEIPGLLPVWRRHQIVDFTRVDIADWFHLRAHRFRLAAKGYAATHIDGITVYLHHMLIGHQPRGSGKVTDHINRDALDNRCTNLRVVTQKENCANRGGMFEKAA